MTKLVTELRLLQADSYVLYVKTQTFHWHLRGPRFLTLHSFLEAQYKHLLETIDAIAERIVMLGSRAPGSLKEILSEKTLDEVEDPYKIREGEALRILAADHAKLIDDLKEAITIAEASNDPTSANLLSDALGFHEKSLWMIKAQMES